MIELSNQDEVLGFSVWRPDSKYLLAASDGRGFIVAARDLLAQTRGGRQVLNLGAGAEALVAVPADGRYGRGDRGEPPLAPVLARRGAGR